ncbi:MAG: hypothetical protein P4M11_02460 [Candidatus Pacebacteria bacterium]|nr:hypothetical protein [Candidatus Paceibacterota bacterium]
MEKIEALVLWHTCNDSGAIVSFFATHFRGTGEEFRAAIEEQGKSAGGGTLHSFPYQIVLLPSGPAAKEWKFVIKRNEGGYNAALEGNPEMWASGATPGEALGYWMLTHPESIPVKVRMSE